MSLRNEHNAQEESLLKRRLHIQTREYELLKNDVIIGYHRNSKDMPLFKDVRVKLCDLYCLKHNC